MIFWLLISALVALVVGYSLLPNEPQDFIYDDVQVWSLFLVSAMALAVCPPRRLYARAALLVITLYHLDVALTDHWISRNDFLASQAGMFAEVAVFVVVGALGIWRLVVSARQQSAPDFARAFHRNGDR